jgi:hypothetical protein
MLGRLLPPELPMLREPPLGDTAKTDVPKDTTNRIAENEKHLSSFFLILALLDQIEIHRYLNLMPFTPRKYTSQNAQKRDITTYAPSKLARASQKRNRDAPEGAPTLDIFWL